MNRKWVGESGRMGISIAFYRTAWGLVSFLLALVLAGRAAQAQSFIYVSDQAKIFRVEKATGDRTVISSDTVGSGPQFTPPSDLVGFAPLSGIGGLVIENTDSLLVMDVLDASARRLFRVDISTGNRTLLAATGDGNGPDWGGLGTPDLTLDQNGTLLVGSDYQNFGITRIDPANGSRTAVSPVEEFFGDVVVRNDGTLLGASAILPGATLILDSLDQIDPVTGAGTPFFVPPMSVIMTGLYAVEAADSILVSQIDLLTTGSWEIARITPNGASSSVVTNSDLGIGAGPPLPGVFQTLAFLLDIKVDSARTILVTGTGSPSIFAVDPLSGDRSVISSNASAFNVGTGPEFREGISRPRMMLAVGASAPAPINRASRWRAYR